MFFTQRQTHPIKWQKWLAISLATLWLASCQNLTLGPAAPTAATPGQPGCPVKIGVITSLSGDFAEQAQELVRGYEMALDDLNAVGGITGCQVELVTKDDASDPQTATVQFKELAQRGQVPLIVGSFSSDATLPLVPLATRYQVPLLAHNAGSVLVTSLGSEWVFRTTIQSEAAVTALLDYVLTLLPSDPTPSLAIVYENNVFGQAAARPVTSHAKDVGISLVAAEAFVPGSPDFKPLLKRVQAAEPDVIFLSGNQQSDALLLMQQSRELDLNPQAYMSNGGAFTSLQFFQSPYSNYLIVSVPWVPSVNWQDANGLTTQSFIQRFQARYGSPPGSRSVNAYVNIFLAAQALELAAQNEPLSGTDIAGVRLAVRNALRGLDLPETLFGPVRFDETGQNDHPPLLVQVVQGQLTVVSPTEQSTGEVIFPVPPWSQRAIDQE